MGSVIKIISYIMYGENTMLKNAGESLVLMSLLKTNILKLLQIISIVAVIIASILFVHIGVFGVQENESIKEILSLPSVKERFIKTYVKNTENQASRLLREVEVFAQYLPIKYRCTRHLWFPHIFVAKCASTV